MCVSRLQFISDARSNFASEKRTKAMWIIVLRHARNAITKQMSRYLKESAKNERLQYAHAASTYECTRGLQAKEWKSCKLATSSANAISPRAGMLVRFCSNSFYVAALVLRSPGERIKLPYNLILNFKEKFQTVVSSSTHMQKCKQNASKRKAILATSTSSSNRNDWPKTKTPTGPRLFLFSAVLRFSSVPKPGKLLS